MGLRWRHWVWSCIGAAAWAGCATAPPPQALVEARAAYQEAANGPAAKERPQDVADAWQALLEAERAYDKAPGSPRARSLAYVALRKAQLAEVRASTEVAARERALAEQSLSQAREAERQRAQQELQTAQQQLAEARRQRAQAEELARQGATQQEVARLQAEAERQRQEAERLQGDAQRRQQEEQQRQAASQRQQQEEQQRQTEAQRRQQEEQQARADAQRQQQEEQQRRVEAEAQAQALSQQLEQERQARQEAERRASEQVEAERQARMAAEQRATLALNALQGVKVREEARGVVVTLSGSVLFASGKAELLPASRNRLEEVAKALEKADSPIVIEGHTDSRGTEEYNEELSRERALAVRDFLVSRGVPAERVEARGMGEYRPVANNTSAEGRANNRRVEIILPRNVATSGKRTGGTGGAGEVQGEDSDTTVPQKETPRDPATQPENPLSPPGNGEGRQVEER